MNKSLTLPLGQPAASLSDPDKLSYLQNFSQALQPVANSEFTPYTPLRTLFINLPPGDPQLADFSKIYALWDGVAEKAFGDMVSVQMSAVLYKQLTDKYYGEIPIPQYALYGPLTNTTLGPPKKYKSGDLLGNMPAGQAFNLMFLDANLYHLDPFFYCQFFLNEGLWNLPAGAVMPLVPAAPDKLQIAGPDILTAPAPYLILEGGSKNTRVMNPANPLPPVYFSFISNDPLTVKTGGTIANPTLTLTDVTDPMYRTTKNPPNFSPAGAAPWTINLETNLKSFHKPYLKANGKKTPGARLTYHLLAGALSTQIAQDTKDIIRQEYRFHNLPFQGAGNALTVPDRNKVLFNNKNSAHFTAQQIQNSNYNTADNNWVLNAGETLLVAEFIRARYADSVAARKITDPAEYTLVVTDNLAVNSSWRNPERNEAVGGVIISNHQNGKALDLKSIHRGGVVTANADNVGAFVSLLAAGQAFLERLIALNNAASCTAVEILLERNASLFWKIRVNGTTGAIISESGGGYPNPQPPNTLDAIKKAAKTATHVHIGWKHANAAQSLILPDISETDQLLDELPFKNIILIATEDSSVDAGDQLALNHAAASIKKFLEAKTPGIPTEIHEVSNALEFLTHCNAFRSPGYQIKYFFSFSHAWSKGLVLKHYPLSFNTDTLKDPVFLETINWFYGYPADEEYGEDSTEEPATPKRLEYGTDDFTQIMPHQFRITNLKLLPKPCIESMRLSFQQSAGVYLVGCNSANEDTAANSNVSEAFATAIQRPVYGAAYASSFFKPSADGKWEPVTITRQDPAPAFPLILVPGKYGTKALAAYLWNYLGSLPPLIPDIPASTNLLSVYNTMLTPCYPKRSASVVQ